MYTASIDLSSTLPSLAPFLARESTLSPFFSVRPLHSFSLFFTLKSVSPLFATHAKSAPLGTPFTVLGLMPYLKFVTIRLTVPAVLSSFLVSIYLLEFRHGL